MIEAFLNSLEPDAAPLLTAISKHITDDMLEEIAQADYGGRDLHAFGISRDIDDETTVEFQEIYGKAFQIGQ